MFPTTRSDHVRSRVTLDEIGGLQITIPAARSPSLRLFLGVWLIFRLFGELAALGSLAKLVFGLAPPPSPDILISWLTFFTVAVVLLRDPKTTRPVACRLHRVPRGVHYRIAA
jgi:hypothetical protein